jgi:putative phosphoribosyl transferase
VEPLVEQVICPVRPDRFRTVGQWYSDFNPVGEGEVLVLLQGGAAVSAAGAAAAGPGRDVTVRASGVNLCGRLSVPQDAAGLVVFAHAGASGRYSPRSRYLAAILQRCGLGTFLLDLLAPDEEIDSHHVFDIGLLGDRLAGVIAWLAGRVGTAGLPVGVLGAGTGAAAGLWAAAEPETSIAAVVCRGGRPDLAGARLGQVPAPTLLIVGGRDCLVADLNRVAQERMHGATRLAVVPGATHLFVEPGTLALVAALTSDWFATHLGPAGADQRQVQVDPAGDAARPGYHTGVRPDKARVS